LTFSSRKTLGWWCSIILATSKKSVPWASHLPLNGPKLKTIFHPEDGSEGKDGHFIEGKKGKVSKKYTLTDNLWIYLQNYAEKHRKKGNGFGFGLCGAINIRSRFCGTKLLALITFQWT
jgi:hypothetical protein